MLGFLDGKYLSLNIFIGATQSHENDDGFSLGFHDVKTNTGSGSSSDPYVNFLDIEFTSTQVGDFGLPELTDTIACYFQPDNRVDGRLGGTIDLSNTNVYTLVNSVVSGSSGDDIANESTSKAFSFNGISILLTLLGLMSYNL